MPTVGSRPSPLDHPRRAVGPVPFRAAAFPSAIDGICSAAVDPAAGIAVHFANAYSVALADQDPSYAEVLADPGSATFCDGVPITWVARRAYPELRDSWQRVYGPDVMTAVFQKCHDEQLAHRHYLLGGTQEVVDSLRATVESRWPRARVVGAESPPFRPLTAAEREQQIGRLRESGATMVWVGLGTPKQDFVARDLARELSAVILAVGAAFDFLAGNKPQAPRWMQRSGTEWAYRLAREPRRLGRRYMWGNPRFLLAAARHPGLGRGSGHV